MNYEEKYKKALEIAKEVYHDHRKDRYWRDWLTKLFPELVESEGEKIRKELIEHIKANKEADYVLFKKFSPDNVIAWLEKQQSFDKDKLAKGFLRSVATSIMNWLDANTSEGKMCLSNMECEDIENAVRNADWSKIYAYMRKKLEKQDEQKFSDFSDIRTWKYIVDMVLTEKDGIGNYLDNSDTERIAKKLQRKFVNIEKQGEQPTDKVEPKFKVGDWITNGNYTWEVANITELVYVLRSQRDIVDDDISYVDENFNLWTINDAKDGDVLVTTSIRNCPFIYRKTDNNNNLAYCYAGIDGNGNFCEGCIKRTLYHFGSASNVAPASKEQRDLLFQKMKEAGYEWGSDKKELKKIEPKMLDANKVIDWLENQACLGWVEDVEVNTFVNKFKKDFGL